MFENVFVGFAIERLNVIEAFMKLVGRKETVSVKLLSQNVFIQIWASG